MDPMGTLNNTTSSPLLHPVTGETHHSRTIRVRRSLCRVQAGLGTVLRFQRKSDAGRANSTTDLHKIGKSQLNRWELYSYGHANQL